MSILSPSPPSRSPQSRALPELWREKAPVHFDSAIPWWIKVALVVAAAVLAVLFVDQRVAVWCYEHRHLIPDLYRQGEKKPGDIGRELMMLEQWGGPTCATIIVIAVFLLDRAGRRRAYSIAVACIWTAIVTHLLKDLIGRSRPFVATQGLNGHWSWGGPAMGFTHGSAWGSLPSAHTSAAFALAAALAWYYPRGRWLFVALSLGTAAQRVLHAAHYVSDVIVGMGVGVFVTRATLSWGITGRTFRRFPKFMRDWWLADWGAKKSPL